MARLLITGGAGFIGANLAGRAIAAGHEVHLIVRQQSNDERLVSLDGRFVRHSFDLRSESDLRYCLTTVFPEYIYHLAASPRRLQKDDLSDVRDGFFDHLLGLASLIGIAARLRNPPRRIIRTGSLAEYGSAPAPYLESGRVEPVNAYGAELTAATQMAVALRSRVPFPIVTARLALIYGNLQSTDYLVPRLITQCLAGKPTMLSHPTDRRDLLHVDDVVVPLLRLMDVELSGVSILNIATGKAPTMRAVAELIVRLTGCDGGLISYGSKDASSGIIDFRGDIHLTRGLLDWSARIPLEEGMRSTIDFHRSHRATASDVPMQAAGMMDRVS